MRGKEQDGYFLQQTDEISHEKSWTWLRKGNLKRETESLLIAAQNNAIRTNHIKARIDKTQQNSKCRLCGDRDETINHVISECSKLAQKEYKNRHDWAGKMIYRELCKKLKLDQSTERYTHKPKTIRENEAHKILWNFEIERNRLIPVKRPDLVIREETRELDI